MSANDFGTVGNKIPRSKNRLPHPVTPASHPSDGAMSHKVTTVYRREGDNARIVLRGESGQDRPEREWKLQAIRIIDEVIYKRRDSLVKGRSRNAHANSGKPHHFTHTQGSHDVTLDTPYTAGQFNTNQFDRAGRKVRRLRAR